MDYIAKDLEKFNNEISLFLNQKKVSCAQVSNIENSANALSIEYKSLKDLFNFLEVKDLIFVGLITESVNNKDYQNAYNELRGEDYLVDTMSKHSNDVDKLGYLKLFAITDDGRLMHFFEAYTILYNIVNGDLPSDNIDIEDNSISDEDMEKCIQQVVNNPKLAKSDTLAYIQTLLETELKNFKNGKRVYSIQKIEMARRIQTIYRDEIKPNQEEELSEKALELKKQGFTKLEIARKLKISISKLNKLI